MAKREDIIIEKDGNFDDVDAGFAASDDNFDLIFRELDIVNTALAMDKNSRCVRECNESMTDEQREHKSMQQRQWRKDNPDKLREYNERRAAKRRAQASVAAKISRGTSNVKSAKAEPKMPTDVKSNDDR